MNLEQFTENFKNLRNVDQVEVDLLCAHPLHLKEEIKIAKGPAKRNFLKHGGIKFICRICEMKYNNPTKRESENRQTNEEILVACQHPEHKGERSRLMKKSCYYGELKEPYSQTCKSCAQIGKIITEDQKEKISNTLKNIPKSNEFKIKLKTYWKVNPEHKEKAIKILLENHCNTGMLGKNHSNETKQKMSEAHNGIKFTEEHCKNISEGRKKMLAETGGFTQEHRQKLSQATAKQYLEGFNPQLHHKKGWHKSQKAGEIFYRSSYEKKAYLILDKDENVINYKTENIQIKFFNPIKNMDSIYLVDIEVEYKNQKRKIIEIKPEKWLKDQIVILKIEAAKKYAKESNIEFEVWTELKLFGPIFNKNQINNFIESFDESHKEKIKEKANQRSKKYYQNHISQDKIEIFCEFCKENHNPLKLTYDKNIERNGRYICEKEGGFIAGSLPKPHLIKENPYAKDNKKQCTYCNQILDINEFGKDKSRRDGYANICKKDRTKIAMEKYNANKNKNPS